MSIDLNERCHWYALRVKKDASLEAGLLTVRLLSANITFEEAKEKRDPSDLALLPEKQLRAIQDMIEKATHKTQSTGFVLEIEGREVEDSWLLTGNWRVYEVDMAGHTFPVDPNIADAIMEEAGKYEQRYCVMLMSPTVAQHVFHTETIH